MVNTIKSECDNHSQNNNVVRFTPQEIPMSDMSYQQVEHEKDGMKIVLEFPTKSEQTESLNKEVKSILSSVLQEQLQKIS